MSHSGGDDVGTDGTCIANRRLVDALGPVSLLVDVVHHAGRGDRMERMFSMHARLW